MSKANGQVSRKVWQPLNRKSQLLVTIVALAAAVQVYQWQTQATPSQPQSIQKFNSQDNSQNQ